MVCITTFALRATTIVLVTSNYTNFKLMPRGATILLQLVFLKYAVDILLNGAEDKLVKPNNISRTFQVYNKNILISEDLALFLVSLVSCISHRIVGGYTQLTTSPYSTFSGASIFLCWQAACVALGALNILHYIYDKKQQSTPPDANTVLSKSLKIGLISFLCYSFLAPTVHCMLEYLSHIYLPDYAICYGANQLLAALCGYGLAQQCDQFVIERV